MQSCIKIYSTSNHFQFILIRSSTKIPTLCNTGKLDCLSCCFISTEVWILYNKIFTFLVKMMLVIGKAWICSAVTVFDKWIFHVSKSKYWIMKLRRVKTLMWLWSVYLDYVACTHFPLLLHYYFQISVIRTGKAFHGSSKTQNANSFCQGKL